MVSWPSKPNVLTSSAHDHWVLIPGTLCTPQVFAPMLAHLGVPATRRTFIQPDAPRVADYAARLRDCVIGGEIVCGFSLGALIAMHNLDALRRARAIILLAANPHPDPPANYAARVAVRDRILAGRAADWVSEGWNRMSSSRDPDLRARVIAMATATAQLIPAQTELAASRPSAVEALRETDLPLLFVTGAEDRLTPPDALREPAHAAQNAELRVLNGLGHFALLEDPAGIAQTIADALTTLLTHNDPEDQDHRPRNDPTHAA